jgi:DNA-directed RNA polymerase specialized sigma24 family protein
VVDDALRECRARADELASGSAALAEARSSAVMAARAEGASLREIGEAIGMSGAGVHKLIARHGRAGHGAAA